MSVQNPLRLLDLAGMSLLRDEASAIMALKDLPTELLPPLFMEAFCGRYSETLKAMVQAWPFVRLPLGGLMKMPHLGTLQAVLDGLDILLAQKDHPRRCKLRVLDLRNTSQDFWRMWSGDRAHGCSSSLMAQVAEDRSRTKQPMAPLEVFIELHLKERTLDGFLTYLIRWVEQRKASVHLCCKKLRILSFPMENTMKVLSMVQLDCIQEVQVNCAWHLSTLAMFAPLLGQMNKMIRLTLGLGRSLVSLLEVNFHLGFQDLIALFLPRCLMTPLDNLAITHCLLSDSDLSHLSQCPNISQLKGLDLSGVTLTYSSPELLPVLLQKVAATLQELYLEQCGIRDSHLEAILQSLGRCSQLMFFSLRGNLISMAMMEKLLRHTSGLPSLSQELYPVPQESYSSQGILQLGKFAQCRTELFEILRVLGRPRIIWISSSPCLHYTVEIRLHVELLLQNTH
uniref:Uncharacterized protein n=1 Tax=Balaenoptera musculus TaxID=9771 RepID=A0A8C0CT93_BALMU